MFDEDRRYAEAFYKGGLEAEREERKKYKKEQEDKHMANHLAFKEMIERARREGQANAQAQAGSNEEGANNSNSQQNGDIANHGDQIPELEDVPSEEQKSTDNSQSLTTYNSEASDRPSTPSSNQSRDRPRMFDKAESSGSQRDSLNSSFDSKRKSSVQGDSSSERGDNDTDIPNLTAVVDKSNYLDELE